MATVRRPCSLLLTCIDQVLGFAHVYTCAIAFLVDVSDIFYFFLLGEGKGESEVGGGGSVFIENSRRRERVSRRGRGAGRVSVANLWGEGT